MKEPKSWCWYPSELRAWRARVRMSLPDLHAALEDGGWGDGLPGVERMRVSWDVDGGSGPEDWGGVQRVAVALGICPSHLITPPPLRGRLRSGQLDDGSVSDALGVVRAALRLPRSFSLRRGS